METLFMTDAPNGSCAGIDMVKLMEIMDNDMELIQDCFTDSIETWPQFFKAISSAGQAGDAKALCDAAHSFKGSLQYLAAMPAEAIVLRLEARGRSGDLSGISSDLKSLEMECRALEGYMASQLSG